LASWPFISGSHLSAADLAKTEATIESLVTAAKKAV
jgi:hypothetical protein